MGRCSERLSNGANTIKTKRIYLLLVVAFLIFCIGLISRAQEAMELDSARSRRTAGPIELDEWDMSYFQVDQEMLFELILVNTASYSN